jgi:hypothetical protein
VDVVETLDLSAIYASYEAGDGSGQAAYGPEMMVRVLLFGFATGPTVRARSRHGRLRMWRYGTCRPTSIQTMTR